MRYYIIQVCSVVQVSTTARDVKFHKYKQTFIVRDDDAIVFLSKAAREFMTKLT